jgi:hypothetical protein
VPALADGPLLMAGHQPELFHPGVWVKNFALCGLAHRHGGVAVNLVVDNDTVKSTALRLPTLTTDHPATKESRPYLATVPFDHWAAAEPYEEARVRDESLFRSFPDRVAPLTREWGFQPLLGDFWEGMCRLEQTPLLGERFARGRRSLERSWGCHNFEVPVSRVCATEPFALFACHLLTELPRFHALYNSTVQAYRRQHGIRSRNHPVPDLAATDGWLELPFWAWRAGQVRRHRLLARQTGAGLELRAGEERWPTLPFDQGGSAQRLVSAWLELEKHGYKVRSRALTNTLYARLLLCELFIHGIGGGKYDELTDLLIRDFYGIEPPRYLVLSATLLLPFAGYAVRPDDCRRLGRELRDLAWNPQRHLDRADLEDGGVRELAEQKRRWLAVAPSSREQRRERFRALRAVTEPLRSRMAERMRELREELERCERQLRGNAILQRRDYAFCLYPEARLKPFCVRFLNG